jgi:hypothetical protein
MSLPYYLVIFMEMLLLLLLLPGCVGTRYPFFFVTLLRLSCIDL